MGNILMEDLKRVESTNLATRRPKTVLTLLEEITSCIPDMREDITEDITEDIRDKFLICLQKDRKKTLSWLFYLRDIYDGLGERQSFRELMLLASSHIPEETFSKIIQSGVIPEIGRWDDLIYLFANIKDKNKKREVGSYLMDRFTSDYNSLLVPNKTGEISLLAKWMPSENTSSKTSRKVAREFIKFLNTTPRVYRTILSALRKHLDVVERKMSLGEWEKIDYTKVPSKASMVYRNSFLKHDFTRRSQYLNTCNRLKKQVDSVFPYEIVKQYRNSLLYDYESYDETLEILWDELKSYDFLKDTLVIRDNSDSMYDYISHTSNLQCIDIADSLVLYCTERETGKYHNKFLSLGDKEEIVEFSENMSLRGKLRQLLDEYDYDGVKNIDIYRVFLKILLDAIDNHISNSELPKNILMVTNTDFNYRFNSKVSIFDRLKREYEMNGYNLPKVIIWRVGGKKDTVMRQESNVLFLSGFSPRVLDVFKYGITDSSDLLDKEISRYYKFLE